MTTRAQERFLTNTTLGATPFLLPTPQKTTGVPSTPSATADITSTAKRDYITATAVIITPKSVGR